MANAELGERGILRRLRGEDCPVCERGELELGTYKGNRAVVCDSCDTPRAQLW
ncbi:HVO_A0556 family zinc finger protein [Halovivax gelatinilyticus]|uniref:HVO_A0556 family zinc finger protein n=1 Tax=Halovivax gelatinilyticus TaxID=2961597 RepID=UPI0020CA6F63|nr:HVO_A0556 family zinc finger protein [Halovivax gelatinilyticus]